MRRRAIRFTARGRVCTGTAESAGDLADIPIGGGDRQAYVLAPGVAVDLARYADDSEPCEPVGQCPAVLAVAPYPEVEATLGLIHAEPGRLQGRFQHPAAAEVALALFADVLVIHQRGGHRG